MKHREVSDDRRRKQMLPRKGLRIISLLLPLILASSLLFQSIWHLEICAAEHQRELQEIIRRRVVVKRGEIARRAPDVVEVLDPRRIKVTMCRRTRKSSEPSEFLKVPAKSCRRIAGDEASDIAGDLSGNRHVEPRLGVHVHDGAELIAELGGNSAGQDLDVGSSTRINRRGKYRR